MNKLPVNNSSSLIIVVSIILLHLIFLSCSPIRKYPAGSFLLKKNSISITNNFVSKDNIKDLIKQIPNRKNLGLYLNIRFWNMASKGKENGFKRWLKRTLATEPIIFDSVLMKASVKQIKIYLQNHGYFVSDISSSVKYKRRNAKVAYEIQTSEPYKIREVSYNIKDATLKAFVYSYKYDCKIKADDIYNLDNLEAERDRIYKNMQKNGYFYFSKDYISFMIDSSLNSHQVDITIKIAGVLNPSPTKTDSFVISKHKRYNIDKIIVNTDYDLNKYQSILYDTLKTVIPNRIKGRPSKVYYIAYPGKLNINLRTLAQAIYIDSNDVFNYADVEKTYKSLLDLRLYRLVNIEFVPKFDTLPASGLLDCIIKLSKSPVQAISVSTDATHTGGELGVDIGFTYTNKNLFKGAELFGLKLKGAVEFQSFNKKNQSEKLVIEKFKFINTIETGVDLEIKIPRFLLPVNQARFPKYFKPKTNINGVFNYQIRPQYERFFTSASFGYQWKENQYKTHIITPIQINLVKIYPDSLFSAQIDSLKDKTLQNTYQDHITSSLSYTFLYTTQQLNKNEDFIFLKTNVEFAGVLFYIMSRIQKKQGSYKLFNIPYSQYFRVDADFRYYMFLNSNNILVYRTYAGFGLPFDKENVLPFEKSFYMGGANSMRAWRLKTLGPGSYSGDNTYALEKIGDIGLEFNIEYRYPIYKFLKGAAFIDVGNIWIRKPSEQLPGADFRFDKFIGELAFDGGLGLRADFGYFIIRLDGAVVLKDPAKPKNSRWIGQNDDRFLVFGSFGIGYPF